MVLQRPRYIKSKKYLLGVMCLLIGALLIVYPWTAKVYTWYWQQRIFEELIAEEYDKLQADYRLMQQAEEMPDESLPAEEDGATVSTASAVLPDDPDHISQPQANVKGLLLIPEIGLKLPISEGVGVHALKIGAGHIRGTAWAGEIGNIVLAGHNSATDGRLFSRLNSLNEGELVTIDTGGEKYNYRIFDQKEVADDDLSVLYTNEDSELLTLITCLDGDNSRRLVLQARRVQ